MPLQFTPADEKETVLIHIQTTNSIASLNEHCMNLCTHIMKHCSF